MFQPETVSRPEADGAFAEFLNQLKMRGLPLPFFGTLPASINYNSRKKIREAGTRILEFGEIQAYDEHRINASAIRQRFPPAAVPQRNRQLPAKTPWSAAQLPHTERGAHSSNGRTPRYLKRFAVFWRI